MSDKELAYSLIDELPEEYLEKAIVLLVKLAKEKKDAEDSERRRRAYDKITSMLKPAPPDFDPEKEREEYYREKYGL